MYSLISNELQKKKYQKFPYPFPNPFSFHRKRKYSLFIEFHNRRHGTLLNEQQVHLACATISRGGCSQKDRTYF